MRKIAMCVGINKYPNPANCLRGCVNDANRLSKYLKEKKGFIVETILDDHATIEKIKSALEKNLKLCDVGDHFVWTSSSHGTQVLDRHGDEADKKDEAICMYNGNIIDDDIRTIFNSAKPGVKITIISDSCFSGTVTRAVNNITPVYMKPRFIIPHFNLADIANPPKLRKKLFRTAKSEEDMNEILISGCSDSQYSADAFINGSFCGALTHFTLDILNNATSDLTYNQFYQELRKKLPSGEYDQIPQMEGKAVNKDSIMFS